MVFCLFGIVLSLVFYSFVLCVNVVHVFWRLVTTMLFLVLCAWMCLWNNLVCDPCVSKNKLCGFEKSNFSTIISIVLLWKCMEVLELLFLVNIFFVLLDFLWWVCVRCASDEIMYNSRIIVDDGEQLEDFKKQRI
jgi:hypothetical protein